MGNLTKKIKNFVHTNFIDYEDFNYIDIEKYELIPFIYQLTERKTNKTFYFQYNNQVNLSTNLEILASLIKYHFGYCEILNCKECERYKKHKDYQNCKRNCFYAFYCRKRDVYDF